MKSTLGWGILGAGNIANSFATDLKNLPDAALVAVGSRSTAKAAAFAEKFDVRRAYGSYAELMDDPDVEVVYIATPHPFHKEHTIQCLRRGKAVLCEKPMAVNEREVREMVKCAREHGAFLMEAMWTRFLPVMETVREWLEERRIGDARMLTADFGFRTGWDPQSRLLNPGLAGGALLDVGVYTVALASMVFGSPPVEMHAAAHIGETGVDEQAGMIFRYEGGPLALLSCAIRTRMPQEARIDGTEGSIHIPIFWRTTEATLRVDGQEPLHISGPAGYHYEAAEVMACLRAGKVESPLMPLDESIAIARTMDQVRAMIGLTYPMENVA